MNKRGNKRVNKKGQFYLVAGIIIVSVIIGFVAMMNYTKKSKTLIVNDLKEELKIETQKVLNYDILHSSVEIRQYGKDYSSHAGGDIELYFIMGDNPDIVAYQYINGVETTELTQPSIDGDKIIFTLDGTDYEFTLRSGENFYFLVSQEIKGERFVATG